MGNEQYVLDNDKLIGKVTGIQYDKDMMPTILIDTFDMPYPDPGFIKYVMGADNGYSGFLVFLNIRTGKIAYMEQFPRDNAKRLYELIQTYRPEFAVIEQPFMAPGFRGVATSNFEILGRYKSVFELLDIPYDCVRATSWRKTLQIKATATHNEKGEGISKRDSNKFAAIDFCKEHFADQFDDKLTVLEKHIVNHKKVGTVVPDDNKCESACIAYYALQQWRQNNDK